jgi:hypothetical protein
LIGPLSRITTPLRLIASTRSVALLMNSRSSFWLTASPRGSATRRQRWHSQAPPGAALKALLNCWAFRGVHDKREAAMAVRTATRASRGQKVSVTETFRRRRPRRPGSSSLRPPPRSISLSVPPTAKPTCSADIEVKPAAGGRACGSHRPACLAEGARARLTRGTGREGSGAMTWLLGIDPGLGGALRTRIDPPAVHRLDTRGTLSPFRPSGARRALPETTRKFRSVAH